MKKADFPFFRNNPSPVKSVSAYDIGRRSLVQGSSKILVGCRKDIDFDKQQKILELNSAISRVNTMRAQEERIRQLRKKKLIEDASKSFAKLGEEEDIQKLNAMDLSKAIEASRDIKSHLEAKHQEQPAEAPKAEETKKEEVPEKTERIEEAKVKSDDALKESLSQAAKQNAELSGKLGTDVSTDELLKNVLDDLF